MPRLQLLLLLVAVLICTATAQGQFGGPGAKPTAKAVKSDVKYIKCQVCEAIAKHAIREVKAMREELKPGKKVRHAINGVLQGHLLTVPGRQICHIPSKSSLSSQGSVSELASLPATAQTCPSCVIMVPLQPAEMSIA